MPEQPGDLDQLRELLIGPELAGLASVQNRISDPARRTEDLAQVLPEAIKAAKGKSLRDALEPIVERSFHSSVRKNPKELADAIYPIIGPAIRTSIAAAIRDFAEALNQIVEKSASFRAISWRIEAIFTGRPFSEILLAKSLLYSVEQVFLIHRKSGLLLQHAAAQGAVLKDADMISGMLTAIQDFLSDSFTEGGQDLETVDAGKFKLWLTYSPQLLLVGAVSGTAPVELRGKFRKALDGIEEALQTQVANFKQDDLSVFEPAQPFLQACLLGQSAPEKRKKATLLPYLAAIAVILFALLGYQAWQRSRWNQYFATLKQQPGIAITGIERTGNSYVVTGLLDPGAPDPQILLRASGLDPGHAKFNLLPYLSLNTPFAAQREFDADRAAIEDHIIRFDSGNSKLAPGEADRIDDVTAAIKRLLRARPAAKVIVTGHADETGSLETNDKLSLDRANRVGDALIAQGISSASITIVGAGNTEQLRPGVTEWDRAVNRSASFKVTAAQ